MADDDKIIRLLQEDGAPALGEDAKQRIAARAVAEFRQARPAAGTGMRRLPLWGGMALGAVAACLVMLLATRHDLSTVTNIREQQEREQVMLAQFNDMFRGRLRAVISAGGQTQIVLSESELPAQRQPVAIRLTEKGQTVDIVSFSGENVKVKIAGREVDFDTLVDGQGKVILAGEELFWREGANPRKGQDLTVNARLMEM
jgi:hypothetical protein